MVGGEVGNGGRDIWDVWADCEPPGFMCGGKTGRLQRMDQSGDRLGDLLELISSLIATQLPFMELL